MRALRRAEKDKSFWFIFISGFVFFLLRFPSLFEPYWYGDEGIYQVLGMGIKQGRLLYRDIFDNKPPLLYVFYSFFNGDQFWIRFLSLVFGILTVIIFFEITKKLFTDKKASYASTALFAFLFGIPLIEGNIANAENFMLLPILTGGFLLLNLSKVINLSHVTKKALSNTNYVLFLAGLLVGIAFLFKIVAVFDFAAFLVFLLFTDKDFALRKLKKLKYVYELFKKLFFYLTGFLTPIILTTLYFLFTGAFSDFLRATLFSNIGYVGYGNKFLIPQGFLILKIAILALFSLLIYVKRNKLETAGIFIFVWFGFSLFNAFFSQRPYTHYLLVLLPSFSLLFGFTIWNKKWRKVSIVILILTLYLATKNFYFFGKTPFYYQNFYAFINNSKSFTKYVKFFDRNTPVDYDLAEYIKSHTKENENIFIWGNNSQVYKLSGKMPPGKYLVAYHISNYKDGIPNTQQALLKAKPKLIIIMHNVPSYPFSLSDYNLKTNINDVLVYERIY